MTINEYLRFTFFFGFLIVWTIMAYKGTTAPEWLVRTRWGKAAWRDSPPVMVRLVSAVFLAAGIVFLGLALWQLSNGTFTWKGSPKTYGFSDFLK